MRVSEVRDRKNEVCREILDDLPEWFGIPEAKVAYVIASTNLPMLAYYHGAEPVGFVSIKRRSPFASELFILGVRRRNHRQGIGASLVEAAAEFALKEGCRFLTVKTIAPTNSDPYYALTRAFYEASGFLPLEEFPTLWSAQNPCLFMIKPLRTSGD